MSLQNCLEEAACCFKNLARSLRVRTFCQNELLANIYCALRGVSFDVRKQTAEIEDLLSLKDDSETFHHELWAFDEDVSVEKRKCFRIPYNSRIKSIQFYTFTKGEGQIKFNIHIDGGIVAPNIASSLEMFTINLNLQVSKSHMVEVEITDEDEYNPWKGLAAYVTYLP